MKSHFTVAFGASPLFRAILLAGPGRPAQPAERLNVRMTQMKNQMRHPYGQVARLGYQMHQLRAQIARLGATAKIGSSDPAPEPPAQKPKKAGAITQPAS